MFEFRRQPFKALFLFFSILAILFILLPYWIIRSAFWRPRRSWTMSRALAVHVFNAFLAIRYRTSVTETKDPEKDAARASELGFVWVDAIPSDLLQGEIAQMAKTNLVEPVRVYGYWLGKRAEDGNHAQVAEPGFKVLYHLHGGGYTGGSGSPKSLTAPIPNGILSECAGLVDRAFCVDYRLSSAPPFEPKNPFPAALIDALAGYRYLITETKFKPEDIIVSGDSAGGHLAVALVRYLVQLNTTSCPPPGSLLLLSPTVDWACTHDDKPTSSMHTNANSDFVSHVMKSGYSARGLLGKLDTEELSTNPWLSPSSLKIINTKGLFNLFPPTCIIVGGAEQTLDPMRTLRDRIISDTSENNILYLEYEDAVHDFIGLTFHKPERSLALTDIHNWIIDPSLSPK